MSLKKLLDEKRITATKPDINEIKDLLSLAARDIKQAAISQVAPDWRLAMAHNAVIQCAAATLNACGFRARLKGYHETLILSLKYTVGLQNSVINRLNVFRRKRHKATYDRIEVVTEKELAEFLDLAGYVRDEVFAWLKREHPELMEDLKD
jgi:hypothetical protein